MKSVCDIENVQAVFTVGDPVGIAYDNKNSGSWVGYVRRIDWTSGLAETAPENLLNSHLSMCKISQLRMKKFTDRKHRDLANHIEHLRLMDKEYAKKYDKDREIVVEAVRSRLDKWS